MKTEEDFNMSILTGFDDLYRIESEKNINLLQGSNPHQRAALYGKFFHSFEPIDTLDFTHNDILSIDAATFLIGEFEKPTLAITKHSSPIYAQSSLSDTFPLPQNLKNQANLLCVTNFTITKNLANQLANLSEDIIILSPTFSPEALEILQNGNRKLICPKDVDNPSNLHEFKSIIGGFLLQDKDFKPASSYFGNLKVVTKTQAKTHHWESLLLAWRVAKHLKFGGAVFAAGEQTSSITAGLLLNNGNLIDLINANSILNLSENSIALNLPIITKDDIEALVNIRIQSIIMPGGSPHDQSLIDYANQQAISIIFTGKTHIKY